MTYEVAVCKVILAVVFVLAGVLVFANEVTERVSTSPLFLVVALFLGVIDFGFSVRLDLRYFGFGLGGLLFEVGVGVVVFRVGRAVVLFLGVGYPDVSVVGGREPGVLLFWN